jgi:SnoaL-like domain
MLAAMTREIIMADIEARITALENTEAIKRLKNDYFFFCDHKQPDRMRECFAEGDIHIDYGRIGSFNHREDLVSVFEQLACADHIIEMHHAQNPRIDLTDESNAKGVWSLFYYMIDTNNNTATQLGGFYEDEYKKINGHWKISSTVFNVTSTHLMDISDGLIKSLFAGRTAPSDIDDPSSVHPSEQAS